MKVVGPRQIRNAVSFTPTRLTFAVQPSHQELACVLFAAEADARRSSLLRFANMPQHDLVARYNCFKPRLHFGSFHSTNRTSAGKPRHSGHKTLLYSYCECCTASPGNSPVRSRTPTMLMVFNEYANSRPQSQQTQ